MAGELLEREAERGVLAAAVERVATGGGGGLVLAQPSGSQPDREVPDDHNCRKFHLDCVGYDGAGVLGARGDPCS